MTITNPCVVDGMTDAEYHADPVEAGSLSSTGARKVLPPGCPALYRHYIDNPEHKDVFDFGKAAHRQVLGVGSDLVVVDAPDWKTRAAREQRDQARAEGLTPVLTKDTTTVEAMADAIRQHPVAGAMFNPERGKPEQSLFWEDPEFKVWRRARVDFLPHPTGDRMILADYKTCTSTEDEALSKSVYNFGYHIQDTWYVDGAKALGLADDVVMVFIFQEKDPPYLIRAIQLDAVALRIGRQQARKALALYKQCRDKGSWPGRPEDVRVLSLPPWAENKHLEELV